MVKYVFRAIMCDRCGKRFADPVALPRHRVADNEDGRVCLSPRELRRAGWRKGDNGVWVAPPPESADPVAAEKPPVAPFNGGIQVRHGWSRAGAGGRGGAGRNGGRQWALSPGGYHKRKTVPR